jgi:hypothetical protein
MKRFGGIEFISKSDFTNINLVNETFIYLLRNLINQMNPSIDPSKIAPLFQINPPQASVSIFFTSHCHLFILSYSRFGIIIKVGHLV